MSITTVGDHLIHYEVLGRGQPLIFIHGWLGSWRYWWPAMQGMSGRFRTFAFDLWGFGDSSKVAEKYSLDHYTEMMSAFIDNLGINTPVTLVGHSLGAAVALNYTLLHSDKIEKVVTVSLPLQGGDINNRLTNSDPDTIVNRVLGKSNSFSEVDSELRKSDAQAVNSLATELSTRNFVEELKACPRPLLVVFGKQDQVVRPPDSEYYQLQQNGQNRFYVELNDSHHFPMLQEPAKFNRLLLDFLLADDSLSNLEPKELWKRRTR